jgi:putative phosphoesterase
MKIAILSDIHGNAMAFKAVLHDMELEKVDHIIVLGDIITDFYEGTKEVIGEIKSITDFVIKGNREKNINDIDDVKKYKQFITTYLTYKELSNDDIGYINLLPEQLSLIFDQYFSIRCVHGSPFSTFEHIFKNDERKITETLNKTNERILLCGHTHEQWFKNINNKIIVNPGSIGMNFSGNKTAQYALLEYKNKDIEIRLKNIEYNFSLFKRACDLNIPWIRLCICGMEDGIVYTVKFLEEAKNKYGVWPIPNNLWDSLFDEWCNKKII